MKDKILAYALGISVVAHLAAVCVIGRTSPMMPGPGSTASEMKHAVKVDFVDNPKDAKKLIKSMPVHVSAPGVVPKTYQKSLTQSNGYVARAPLPKWNSSRPVTSSRVSTSTRMPGNPGGRLNVGSQSSHGDLGGNWGGGKTSVGWVSGNDHGTGQGSGNGEGVGTPEPDRNASEGPGTRPAPAVAPPPPPAPRMVGVKVCSVSGLLPGKYCDHTRTESYEEGNEPGRDCDKCKAPEEYKSRLADKAEPSLVKNVQPSIPDSVEEGLSVSVQIEYWVDTDGGVSGVNITRSSGDRNIDRAVMNAASRWKYSPAVQDGVPRRVKMTRSIRVNT